MTGNSNLNGAKRAKNDEFYTRLEDVEAELVHYENHFRDKTVYLNCDDQDSAFWQYFSERFDDLGLRRLVATKYPEGLQFCQDRGEGLQVIQLTGDGDFRSDECVELLKQADIVVTNPPFSLFREYMAQLVEHDKKFLVISNLNAITYKEIFPLIRDGKAWIGATHFNTGMYFGVPDSFVYSSSYKFAREMDGHRVARVPGTMWFTNLNHKKRHEGLDLVRYYEGNEAAYPRYDNYDAVEVSKVKDIPSDYEGVMGVPITFLDKHNLGQFEIVGCSDNGLISDDLKLPHFKRHNEPFAFGSKLYKRIFIRNLNPQSKIEF